MHFFRKVARFVLLSSVTDIKVLRLYFLTLKNWQVQNQKDQSKMKRQRSWETEFCRYQRLQLAAGSSGSPSLFKFHLASSFPIQFDLSLTLSVFLSLSLTLSHSLLLSFPLSLTPIMPFLFLILTLCFLRVFLTINSFPLPLIFSLFLASHSLTLSL